MLSRINLKDLEGWPITKVFSANLDKNIVLVNENGFCMIGIDRAYESCDDTLCEEEFELEDVVWPEEFIENGIFTEEEYHKAKLDKLIRLNQDDRASRVRLYEQLKKEFENATP